MAASTVDFLLPGRRTLSEHLPAEIIEVPFSTVQRSRHLRNIAHRHAEHSSFEKPVELPEVDTLGFRKYISWLLSGSIQLDLPCLPTGSGLLLRDCVDLMFAHIVGAQFGEPDFQDQVIDEMVQVLSATQTPDLKVMEVLFLEKGASAILKQFVVDRMFAVERRMLGMLRGFMDGLMDAKGIEVGCQYHVHEEGKCYRDKAVKRGEKDSRRNLNGHYDETKPNDRRSLDFPSTSSTNNMEPEADVGEEKRSQMVHSLEKSTVTVLDDKPLPPIPPLMCGPTRKSPSLIDMPQLEMPPGKYLDSFNHCTPAECNSTQQLVQECLNRLPLEDKGPTSTPYIPQCSEDDIMTSSSLVAECLQRIPPAQLHNHDAGSSGTPISSQTDRTSDVSISDLNSAHQDPLSSSASFANIQTVSPASTPNTIPPIPVTYYIPRKPVPMRGADWLAQYDRVNKMMGTTSPALPTISAKRSRKSRFVEMMRNESRTKLQGAK